MALFKRFSKEDQSSLEKGLAKTKESVFGRISRALVGKSKVDEEVLDEQKYSDLSIWVRKVTYSTFNLKKTAKKY